MFSPRRRLYEPEAMLDVQLFQYGKEVS